MARRWWILPLTTLAVAGMGYAAAGLQQRLYRGESLVIVSSRADRKDPGLQYDFNPGDAFEASRLALTYSTTLGKDPRLLRRIAFVTGRTVAEVKRHLSLFNDTDTAVLRVRYRDKNRELAAAGSRAAAEAIAGERPVTPAVRRGAITLVSPATRPKRPGNGRLPASIAGAFLGLGLGLILVFGLERADPRLDEPGDCQRATGLPASPLDSLSPQVGAALLERWLALSGGGSARVAILPATRKLEGLAPIAAAWLHGIRDDSSGPRADGDSERSPPAAGAGNPQGPSERPRGGRWITRRRQPEPAATAAPADVGQETVEIAPERIILAAGARPGSESAGELEALRNDVIVLLVQKGARTRSVVGATETLDQFGHVPDWILFVRSPRRVLKRLSAVSDGAPPGREEGDAEQGQQGSTT